MGKSCFQCGMKLTVVECPSLKSVTIVDKAFEKCEYLEVSCLRVAWV